VTTLTRWAGTGRGLTQTGQLTTADARHLIGLLDTGDEIDPVIGNRCTAPAAARSCPASPLCWPGLKPPGYFEWCAAGLVPVKKNRAPALLKAPAPHAAKEVLDALLKAHPDLIEEAERLAAGIGPSPQARGMGNKRDQASPCGEGRLKARQITFRHRDHRRNIDPPAAGTCRPNARTPIRQGQP